MEVASRGTRDHEEGQIPEKDLLMAVRSKNLPVNMYNASLVDVASLATCSCLNAGSDADSPTKDDSAHSTTDETVIAVLDLVPTEGVVTVTIKSFGEGKAVVTVVVNTFMPLLVSTY